MRRPVAPPRPPKPHHLTIPEHKGEDGEAVKYENAFDSENTEDASSVENFQKHPHVDEADRKNEATPSPSTSGIVSDETYDIPRSHQPPDVDLSQNKDAYTNAMPV